MIIGNSFIVFNAKCYYMNWGGRYSRIKFGNRIKSLIITIYLSYIFENLAQEVEKYIVCFFFCFILFLFLL